MKIADLSERAIVMAHSSTSSPSSKTTHHATVPIVDVPDLPSMIKE